MANEPPKKTLSLGTPDVQKPVDPAMSDIDRGVSKEEFDELKAHNEELSAQNALLHSQFEQLMAEIRSQKKAAAVAEHPQPNQLADGETPVLIEDESYGIVTGDSDVGYVQNGHQFSRDKRYLREEIHRGVPRPFNPRLVGVVRKPRIVEAA